MAATRATKQAVRMFLLLAVKDTTRGSLKERYPNVTYVLENPNPAGAADTYGQRLFRRIDPEVYAAFHNKLRDLNDNLPTVASDLSDSSRLGRFYQRAASLTDVVASVYPPGTIWQGGEHPPAQDRDGLQADLE